MLFAVLNPLITPVAVKHGAIRRIAHKCASSRMMLSSCFEVGLSFPKPDILLGLKFMRYRGGINFDKAKTMKNNSALSESKYAVLIASLSWE
jgi:hypothetical protein